LKKYVKIKSLVEISGESGLKNKPCRPIGMPHS
jgi:hypothetical protein